MMLNKRCSSGSLFCLLLSCIFIISSCSLFRKTIEKESISDQSHEKETQFVSEPLLDNVSPAPVKVSVPAPVAVSAPVVSRQPAKENAQVQEIVTLKPVQSDEGEPEIHLVLIESRAKVFEPERLIINVGDTVRWENKDFSIDNHPFQSVPGTHPFDQKKDEISLITLYGGENYEQPFNTIGEYPFFCFIHKGMRGMIIVVKNGQTIKEMRDEVTALRPKTYNKTAVLQKKLQAKEMVLIEKGKFIMGSPEEPTEGPVHLTFLPAFYIDKYEVTNEEYEEFVLATGYKNEGQWRKLFIPGKEKHPVANVSYNDATAYANWAKKRIPSEAEWEKAARGTDRRMWPWGDDFDNEIPNVFGPDDYTRTAPGGVFEEDVSPYGVYDMAGNVSEWTSDQYLPYKDSPGAGYPDFSSKKKVVRGGSFSTVYDEQSRTHSRTGRLPTSFIQSVGFRLVRKK